MKKTGNYLGIGEVAQRSGVAASAPPGGGCWIGWAFPAPTGGRAIIRTSCQAVCASA